jgi:hypothetical protein
VATSLLLIHLGNSSTVVVQATPKNGSEDGVELEVAPPQIPKRRDWSQELAELAKVDPSTLAILSTAVLALIRPRPKTK